MRRYMLGAAAVGVIAVGIAAATLSSGPGTPAASPATTPPAATPTAAQPQPSAPAQTAQATPAAGTADMLRDRVLGSPDAPVTIIEYSSLTCPHCASFHTETLPLIKKQYLDTGKAKLIFRDFPFDAVALRASMTARCLEPGRYFGFLDVLFRSQQTWSRAADPVKALAQNAKLAGMGQPEFDRCQANEELLNGIVQKRLEGEQKFQVDSTPSFIIRRGDREEKIAGAQPFAKFAETLDRFVQ